MPPKKNHRILVVNPRSGNAVSIIRGGKKYYLIKPVSKDLYEIHYDGKYLGESTSLLGAKKFIQRSGADAPVLIKNTNGGYEMYQYKSPTSGEKNPRKKKAGKKKAKKAGKKVGRKKVGKRKSKKAGRKAKRNPSTSMLNPGKKGKKKAKKAGKKKAKKASKRTANPSGKSRGKGKHPTQRMNPRKKAGKKAGKRKASCRTGKTLSVDKTVRIMIEKKTGKKPNW